MAPLRSFSSAGSLFSYGSTFADLLQSAQYADRILRGEEPKNLPVQEPTKYELVINRKTAKAIDLNIAPTFWLAPTRSSNNVSTSQGGEQP